MLKQNVSPPSSRPLREDCSDRSFQVRNVQHFRTRVFFLTPSRVIAMGFENPMVLPYRPGMNATQKVLRFALLGVSYSLF